MSGQFSKQRIDADHNAKPDAQIWAGVSPVKRTPGPVTAAAVPTKENGGTGDWAASVFNSGAHVARDLAPVLSSRNPSHRPK
jgi:hypothetical protein